MRTEVAILLAAASLSALAAPRYWVRPPEEKARRIALIDPAKDGELRLRPTFNSCGVCWGAATEIEGFKVLYRKGPGNAPSAGTPWEPCEYMEYFPETGDYRGSLLRLDEDSEYQVRITAAERILAEASFRTWSSDVPVAKTVTIDPATFIAPMRIDAKGSASGWIRYVVKGGATLEVKQAEPAFIVENAEYVLFDDMKIRGCARSQDVFRLNASRYVRIRNCDIAGWGRRGRPDFSEGSGGKLLEVHPRRKRANIVDWDAAIAINPGCVGCVVERCWIHDPLSTANSWFYSHPAGPMAVGVSRPDHSTVIRYNDFVGSDLHRFNDAVASGGNFVENGGLNRDADVYGNFMIFSNDDCIELDGGQQNVRCFLNRFEQSVCGVSIQGCMEGPSYTFDNVFTGCGDVMGFAYQLVKTSGISLFGDEACAYIFNNEFWDATGGADSPGRIIVSEPAIRYRIFNNRFLGKSLFSGVEKSPKSVERGTVENAGIRRDGPVALPYRPVPFTVDRGMIEDVRLEKGVLSRNAVKVTATVGGEGWSSPFTVAKNDAFDWFDVKPSSGMLRSEAKTEFTVTFDPACLNDRHFYRGAFLVRTGEGFSRPVSVYVSTDFTCPFKPETGDAVAVYVDVFRPSAGSAPPAVDAPDAENGKCLLFADGFGRKDQLVYEFDVPRDGYYFILARGRNDTGATMNAMGRIDDSEWARIRCTVRTFMSWVPFSMPSRCKFNIWVNGFRLGAGRHRFSIRGPISPTYMCEGIVVTDNPGLFDPR